MTKLHQVIAERLQEFHKTYGKVELDTVSKTLFDNITDLYELAKTEETLSPKGTRKMTKKNVSKIYSTQEEFDAAYHMFNAVLRQDEESRKIMADLAGGTTPGSYHIPTAILPTLADLIEKYGVIRRNADVIQMQARYQKHPVYTAPPAAAMVDEAGVITATDPTAKQADLTAKKAAVLCKLSEELEADAVESMVDRLSILMAMAIAQREDQNAFIGDGTATYGGFTGIVNALQAGATVTAPTGSTTFEDLVFDDFEEMIAKVPTYAENQKWFISKYGYYKSMQRLMNAAGGNAIMDLAKGLTTPQFMGYPVEFTQVLPGADAVPGDVVAVFGDLRYAVAFGDRLRDTSIKLSEERYFEYDQIALKLTTRHAIDVFGTGDADNADGIVMLKLATA